MTCRDIEVRLSGYVDGELTQQDAQKVELHLEDCEGCQAVLEELREAQRMTRMIELRHPNAEEWKEMETRIAERLTRGVGWVILIVWSVVTLAYGLFQFAISPEEPLFHKILFFGIFLGIALLFFSVLAERIRESRTDRYKGVQE